MRRVSQAKGARRFPLESASGTRVELAQMSRLYSRLRIVQEKGPA